MKICGITTVEDARCAEEAGADAIGVVVRTPSPRDVGLDTAAEILAAVGPFISTVCVTHTASEEDLEEILALRPSAIQISHDFDLPEDRSVRVIRMLKPGDPLRADCDAVAVDESRGSGRRYDPVYAGYVVERSPVPVILSGGLTPANVREAIDTVKPYAVDVCSGVEIRPGIKDRERIRAFVRACRTVR